jgi:hypothetical protein
MRKLSYFIGLKSSSYYEILSDLCDEYRGELGAIGDIRRAINEKDNAIEAFDGIGMFSYWSFRFLSKVKKALLDTPGAYYDNAKSEYDRLIKDIEYYLSNGDEILQEAHRYENGNATADESAFHSLRIKVNNALDQQYGILDSFNRFLSAMGKKPKPLNQQELDQVSTDLAYPTLQRLIQIIDSFYVLIEKYITAMESQDIANRNEIFKRIINLPLELRKLESPLDKMGHWKKIQQLFWKFEDSFSTDKSKLERAKTQKERARMARTHMKPVLSSLENIMSYTEDLNASYG